MACNQVGGCQVPSFRSQRMRMIAAVQSRSYQPGKSGKPDSYLFGIVWIWLLSVSDSTIAAMIADEAAIGVIQLKTTAVRIIPYGKRCYVRARRGLLGSAPVMKVNKASSTGLCPWWSNSGPQFIVLKIKKKIAGHFARVPGLLMLTGSEVNRSSSPWFPYKKMI